jgi:hypothetical protein
MHFIRCTTFIIALILTVTIIQGKPTHPLSSSNLKDYTEYLLNMMGLENEYARFLSYLKIHPPKDNIRLNALYEDYFSFNSYISDVAQMYTKYYTPQEIGDLIKFYSSPLGIKTIQVNNELNKQVDDLMLTKISDYIFTAAEHGLDIALPDFH